METRAATIREYHQTFVPSLLQTREFTLARLEVDEAGGPLTSDPDHAIDARVTRQLLLRRPSPQCMHAFTGDIQRGQLTRP